VLNSDAPVGERTRAAVEAAIEKLAYVPSNAARTMRSQRSGLIGILTGAISASPGPGEPAGLPDLHIVQGAQRVLAEHQLTVLISDTGGDESRVPGLLQTLLEHRVEGILYVAAYHQRVEFPKSQTTGKLVLVNCFDDSGTPAIVPDDETGQYRLTKGLVERGHRRIGFLTLPEVQVARDLRLEGYRRAVEEAGIGFDPALVITAALMDPNHEFDLLWDALERLLNGEQPPSVICCGNDKMAMRVYGLLRDRGLRVPEDICVAGYDDYRIISEHLHPGLTTVDLPYETMGARAASRLLGMIQGSHEAGSAEPIDLVPGPVVWRGSVTERDRKTIQFRPSRKEGA
jgi:LacI family transcriptional regulator